MFRPSMLLALSLGALLPDEASACTPDPCANTTAFVGLQRVGADVGEVDVPIDGVLVMQAQSFGEMTQDALLAGLTLSVSRDGAPVAGAVEAVYRQGLPGILLWRPAELLVPSVTYEVTGSFANPDGVPGECAAKQVEIGFDFTTAPGRALPLAAPQIWTTASYSESPIVDLDSLICCDGAIPSKQELCGIPQGISWSAGECVSATSRARLAVSLGVASILDNATAGQWGRALYQDGEEIQATLGQSFSRQLSAAACFTIEQFSLASGEVLVSEERCLGDDLTLPLGDLRNNPSELLADLCADTPYICEVGEAGWVAERCIPWPLGPAPAANEEAGCGCASGDPNASFALALLLLLLRRRQSRMRPTTAVVHWP